MSRLAQRPQKLIVRLRLKHNDRTRHSRKPARPQEDYTSNTTRVPAVYHLEIMSAFAIQHTRSRGVDARDV